MALSASCGVGARGIAAPSQNWVGRHCGSVPEARCAMDVDAVAPGGEGTVQAEVMTHPPLAATARADETIPHRARVALRCLHGCASRGGEATSRRAPGGVINQVTHTPDATQALSTSRPPATQAVRRGAYQIYF